MKKTLLIILAVLTLSVGYAQENQEDSNTIEIEQSFRSLDLDGSMRVVIHSIEKTEQPHAIITVKGVPVKDVKWKVRNECLDVRIMQGILNEQADILIDIYALDLRDIKTKGVQMTSTGVICSESISIETLGAQNTINLAIQTKNLTIKTSGDSDIKLSGQTEYALIECRATARVDMLHCPVDKMTCTAAEGAELYAYVDGSFAAKASTNATIYYMGSPRDTQLKATFFGAIVSLDTATENAGKEL